jgi:CSLREA domain-containing protein
MTGEVAAAFGRGRWWLVVRRLGWLAAICIIGLVPGSGVARASAAGGVVLLAPARVGVGEPIWLVLRFDAGAAAGYQARLSFDVGAAELSEVQNRAGTAPAARGWAVRDLGPVELPEGIEFGAYSCLRRDCTGGGATAATASAGGGVLARVELRTDEVGPLELRLSDLEVVDAAGTVLAAGGERVVTVDVTGPGSGAVHEAPAAAAAFRGDPDRRGRLNDATGDSRVDEADVTEAALSWVIAHSRGATCASGTSPAADANDDGCVDVADVQTFAGAAGPLPALRAASSSATFVVDSTSDEGDASPGDGVCATSSGSCTLRAAIQEANATSGPNTIQFAIPGAGVTTIQLASALPTISDTTGGTYIDGYTQPGASVNTDPFADDAKIAVQIRGTGPHGIDGVFVSSGGNTLRGLSFFDLRRSIYLYGVESQNNAVIGCFVGTDASGTFGSSEFDLEGIGIWIDSQASNNQIGTTATADRNVISGNPRHGIATYGDGTDSNVVYNNIIGLSPDGLRRVPNLRHGIDINAGSSFNVIGGTGAGMRNVVSGNGDPADRHGPPSGVEVSHGSSTTGNEIVGNYIGSDLHGEAASWTHNGVYGVHVEDSVENTLVSDNVIIDNPKGGIRFLGALGSGNTATNNLIGITPTGQPGPNGTGVVVEREAGVTIGPGNTIAYNKIGVSIESPSTSNTITRNSIYGNSHLGIDLEPLGDVNPNDSGDIDSGANDKQNFPVIDRASPTLVSGTACAGCTVELFLADSGDPGAGPYGEGKVFLTSTTADSSGAFSVATSAVGGQWVTATATTPTRDTSEFSENVRVAVTPRVPPAPKVKLAPGPRKIVLRWNTPAAIGSAITSYDIYRGTSSGGETLLATVGTMNGYLDVEVAPNATSYYKVAARNGAGEGPASQERAATPTATGILVSDRFDRTVPNGFGSADIGGTWSVSSTARTKVETSEGVIYGWTGGNQDTRAWLPFSVADQDVLALVRLSSTDPVGDAYWARIVARSQTDPRDGYAARLVHYPNGSLTWELLSVQNGGGTGTVVLATGPLASAAAGSSWWVRLVTQGTNIRAKFWQSGLSEPTAWTAKARDTVWPSGGASLGVFAGSKMEPPFPDTGFPNFDADTAG